MSKKQTEPNALLTDAELAADAAPAGQVPAPGAEAESKFSAAAVAHRIKAISEHATAKLEMEARKVKAAAEAETTICETYCFKVNHLEQQRKGMVGFEKSLEAKLAPEEFNRALHCESVGFRSGDVPGSGAIIQFEPRFDEAMQLEFMARQRDAILADAHASSVGKLEAEIEAMRREHRDILKKHGFLG